MQLRFVLPYAILLGGWFSSSSAAEFVVESQNLASNASMANAQVYDKGDCHGGNLSPQLHWSGAPEATKSYAVSMFDPDAHDGRGWWHWVVFDIDATTTSLVVGAGDAARTPLGSSSATNSFGDVGYSGPCPPQDEKLHRYVITVYALGSEHIGLRQGAAADSVAQALESAALASATLQAQYGR